MKCIKRLPFILLIVLGCFEADAQELPSMSFLFMGDFMGHDGQINNAKRNDGSYDYSGYFDHTGPLINSVDYAVANLEVTLAGPPHKGYPQFSSPDAYAEAIQTAGFDILTTANNHSNDRGGAGLVRTLDVLDELGMAHLGTYRNAEERAIQYPMVLEKNGIRVALLNATYGTNGIKTEAPGVVNLLDDKIQLEKDIVQARSMNVDKIIAITHWGKEYLSLPDDYQKWFANWLFDKGVDIIIGGHPHYVQPVEWNAPGTDEESLIVWSLGNAVSNQRKEHTDGGLGVQFSLERQMDGSIRLKNVGYHLHWVWVEKKPSHAQHQIVPVQVFEQNGLHMDDDSIEAIKKFVSNERSLLNEHNINVPEFQRNPETGYYFLPANLNP